MEGRKEFLRMYLNPPEAVSLHAMQYGFSFDQVIRVDLALHSEWTRYTTPPHLATAHEFPRCTDGDLRFNDHSGFSLHKNSPGFDGFLATLAYF